MNSIVDYRDGIELCDKKMQVQFAIYRDRYPKFEQSGSAEQRFSAWKLHLLDGDYEIEGACIIELLLLRVLDSMYNSDIVYCGVFSTSALTEQERLFARSVQQLTSYASMGVSAAFDSLLSLHKPGSSMSLNPDVELFARKFLGKDDESGRFKKVHGVWYTDHLEPLLTPERIEFVNAAVERSDFDAVLETTSSCPTWPNE